MAILHWWETLDLFMPVLSCIAIPATLVLIIQTVLLLIGIGDDADIDDVSDVSDVPDDVPDGVFGEDSVSEAPDASGFEGLRIFTVRGIVAFFVVFGWVGVVMREAGLNLALTLGVAAASGFAMMLALAYIFKATMRLRNDGNTDNRNAVGTAGKVYLTIPPARSGSGKVMILLQGACVERDAVTDDAQAIPTGAEIVVIGVSGQTELVVKRK